MQIATTLISASIRSDASHFSIDGNESVKKSGICETRLFHAYKSNQTKISVWFRSTNISGVETNQTITDLSHTSVGAYTLWLPITVFFVTQLTATVAHICKHSKQWVYLGVKTCEVFLCFVAIVRVRFIMLASLFSLFYVTGERYRFLHRG